MYSIVPCAFLLVDIVFPSFILMQDYIMWNKIGFLSSTPFDCDQIVLLAESHYQIHVTPGQHHNITGKRKGHVRTFPLTLHIFCQINGKPFLRLVSEQDPWPILFSRHVKKFSHQNVLLGA